MNELIKELYLKVNSGKDWAYDFDPDKAQLFAEWIVEECARSIVLKAILSDCTVNSALIECSSSLKKEFGL
jgi:hypothetical protein